MTAISKWLIAIVLAVFMISACGGGGTPEDQLSKIDKFLSKNYEMTIEQARDIKKFTDEGKQFLGNGKKAEAAEKFDQALKILYVVRDTDVLNKSE